MVKYNYLLTNLLIYVFFLQEKQTLAMTLIPPDTSTGISGVIALQVSQYLLLKYPAKNSGQQNKSHFNILGKRACIWKHLCA